jgi:hypothetical protein
MFVPKLAQNGFYPPFMTWGRLWAPYLFLISFGILSSSNTGETGKPELKPFLAARASYS